MLSSVSEAELCVFEEDLRMVIGWCLIYGSVRWYVREIIGTWRCYVTSHILAPAILAG